jgi:hypothetical protein
MKAGDMLWPRREPGVTPLHLIKLLEDPIVEWQLHPAPKEILELWLLRGGRATGEKIGFIGVRETTLEWVMVPGVSIRGGFAPSVEKAAADMMEAIQGGVFAAGHIQSEIVS